MVAERKFYSIFSNAIIKADKDDPTIIYLEASNEQEDQQGEIVLCKALEEETENFLAKGVISWDHQHKLQKDPAFIIGEPLDVKFTKSKQSLIKSKLYEKSDYAQAVIKMVASGSTRLGASIGGNIISKSQVYKEAINKAVPVIEKLKWDEVAITHKPVNMGTYGNVTYTKFNDFGKSFAFADDESLDKALMAGGGVNAANFTGGRALVPESLGKQVTNKEFWKDMIVAIKNEKVTNYKSLGGFLSKYGITGKESVNFIASIVAEKKDSFLSKI